ncbi:aromatic acid exporter family protein [Sutcliffiella halmapala]|uniref:aromatic acid exporter family protein n=1 Tax=Sutcliffiella halmapala TaxID=79882 RepID=UPI0009952F87|nr:aromatic acid exporter family protein [Sutcliffiella halmapala]
MKLGARIVKTGIAITLALFVAQWLDLPSPFFAGIAAIFAIQPSIYRSYQSIIEHIQANLIGAILAIIFSLIFGHDPFIIGLTAIFVIGINLKLKIENTIPLALVTVIAIMESPGENFLEFSLIRFSTVMIGILCAFLVNLFFIPPKYETRLYYKVKVTTEDILKWIRINMRHASEHNLLKTDIENLRQRLLKLEQLFMLYKEERTYFPTRKSSSTKARKLVIFRQLILTSNRALHTLKTLHRLENELHQMPSEYQHYLKAELDHLVNLHEQVLLKFVGKIKQHNTSEMYAEEQFDKSQFIDAFMIHKADFLDSEENADVWYHLFPLVSKIIDYNEQLVHLDKLIDSFQNYHKSENEFDIEQREEE